MNLKKGSLMYAVEFESKIDNGVLKIPSHYTRVIQSNKVKVIIMIENEEIKVKSPKSIFDNFLKMSKNVDDIEIYSRDELHER